MKTTIKCLLGSLLLLLVFTLGTTQAHAQQKGSSNTQEMEDSSAPSDYVDIHTETKVREYYIDPSGKKKYISGSKTQKMWTKILTMCPSCIAIAEENNINIYQNRKYVKKSKD